ncbi:MAG: hypothetical protein JO112_03085, partial [Planctomycetes bacterium]|nr:hypothetical protein [Planctomycetota bacterium]
LDGTRDRAALLEEVLAGVARGEVKLPQDIQTGEDPQQVRKVLAEALEPSLRTLARAALLVE